MKTKLVPLALLIPAVVLAQTGSPPPSQASMPTPSTMPAPPVNPENATNALKNAKAQSKELKSKLPSNGEVGSGFVTSSIGLS